MTSVLPLVRIAQQHSGFKALFSGVPTYITASNGIHSQQVVAMPQLELDHLLCCAEVTKLLLLGLATFFDQIFEQKCIFAHPLNGFQQI